MFKITASKGFQMTFENGYTISVQFGGGNCCSNYSNFELIGREKEQYILESETAEIAIWDHNGSWCTGKFTDEGDGQVAGYLTTNDVFEIMQKVKNA